MGTRAQRPNAASSGRVCPLIASACLLLVGAMPAPVAAGGQERRPERPQTLLLGILVEHVEADVVDVWYDGREFWLPLASFEAWCRCKVVSGGAHIRVQTSLGEVTLGDTDLMSRDTVRYVGEHALRERLAVGVRYRPSLMALELELPWGRPVTDDDRAPVAAPVPDVRAPAASLSSITSHLHHGRQSGRAFSWGTANLLGRAGGGLWRVAYQDTFDGGRRLSEYTWMRAFAAGPLLLAGQQRVQLHPLLSGVELTGVQLAWTNQPLRLFERDPGGNTLLPRQLRSRALIRGAGVPAGFAVLRVNDRTVATQTIPLSGEYVFEDVPLNPSQTNRIEVFVYERHNLQVPVFIRDHSRRASEAMLPAGAMVALAGGGTRGNALEGSGGDVSRPGSGFYQFRIGVSDRLTLESAGQMGDGHFQFVGGGTARLGRNLVTSFAGAAAAGKFAYQIDLVGRVGTWRLQAFSQVRAARFAGLALPASSDQRFEIGRRWDSLGLEVGVVGRHRRGLGEQLDFVLPTVVWNPATRAFLRARPDLDGRYRLDASWNPGLEWQLGASHARGVSTVDVSHVVSDRIRASLFGQVRDAGGSRIAGLFGFSSASWRGMGITAGPLLTNGTAGGLLRVHAQVAPGVLLAAQLSNDALLESPDGARDTRISLDLTTSLAFAGGRVMPSNYTALRSRMGGVSGRLRVRGGYPVEAGALEGVMVRVDGRATARTGRGGRYYIPTLPPGVHRVSIDPARLPIELTPDQTSYLVEVAEGAVSRLDFTLHAEFGIAGRVLVDGHRAMGLLVQLVDDSGAVLAVSRTDRFGLYRFDAVRRGRYQVRLSPENAPGAAIAWPQRAVLVSDDFLFGQDLHLELASAVQRDALRKASQASAGMGAPATGTDRDDGPSGEDPPGWER